MPRPTKPSSKKKLPASAENFWSWFLKNKSRFKKVLENSSQAQQFLDELIRNMKPFNPWFKALAGPYGENRSELIITSDGDIALFCKVEELVNAAPEMEDWKVTAHKPPMGLDRMKINMYGHEFSSDNMNFYPRLDPYYPDEIKLTITHPEYNEDEKDQFQTGGTVFIENALGEVNTATLIDSYEVGAIPNDDVELIPLNKMEEYLRWREKEFIEKYEKMEARKPEESFSVLESEDDGGQPVFATINTGYKNWEFRTAFPWLVQIDVDYKGNEKGMPDKAQSQSLKEIEDHLLENLSATDLIYVGHQTHKNRRTIFAYCSDYNIVSKQIHAYIDVSKWVFDIAFFIRKDKYWRNMEWYFNAQESETH